MIETQNIEHEAQRSLDRTQPQMEGILGSQIKKHYFGWRQFASRLQRIFTYMLMPSLHAAQI